MSTVSPTKQQHDTTLRNCALNVDMTIHSVDLDERHRFRMLELGLRAGTIVRVIQKSIFGGRVVAKGTERIALDGQTASHIHVEVTTHPSVYTI